MVKGSRGVSKSSQAGLHNETTHQWRLTQCGGHRSELSQNKEQGKPFLMWKEERKEHGKWEKMVLDMEPACTACDSQKIVLRM